MGISCMPFHVAQPNRAATPSRTNSSPAPTPLYLCVCRLSSRHRREPTAARAHLFRRSCTRAWRVEPGGERDEGISMLTTSRHGRRFRTNEAFGRGPCAPPHVRCACEWIFVEWVCVVRGPCERYQGAGFSSACTLYESRLAHDGCRQVPWAVCVERAAWPGYGTQVQTRDDD